MASADPKSNAKVLKQIVFAITQAQGRFKLLLVRCDFGALREQAIAAVTEQCGQRGLWVPRLELGAGAQLLVAEIEAFAARSDRPLAGVQVVGWERVADMTELLKSTNLAREALQRGAVMPVVLWLDESQWLRFVEDAPDLQSWGTVKVLRADGEMLTQELALKVEQVLAQLRHSWRGVGEDRSQEWYLMGGAVLSRGERQEWRSALAALEQLGGVATLEPELAAGVAFVQGRSAYSEKQWAEAGRQFEICDRVWHNPGTDANKSQLLDFYQVLLALRTLEENLDSDRPTDPVVYPELGPVMAVVRSRQVDLSGVQLGLWLEKWLEAANGCDNRDSAAETAALEHLLHLGPLGEWGFPRLYVWAMERLAGLYFGAERFVEAFSLRQRMRLIERVYGLGAFVGALNLERWAAAIEEMLQGDALATSTSTALKIEQLGRSKDLTELTQRIGRNDSRLIVIHGPSGTGKSTLVRLGLEPQLRSKSMEGRENLPILVSEYENWVEVLAGRIPPGPPLQGGKIRETHPLAPSQEGGQEVASPLLRGTEGDLAKILERLRDLEHEDVRPVLIFDQFEAFFFAYPKPQQQRVFFEWVGEILDDVTRLGYTTVVLVLREDYLHRLRVCNDWLRAEEVQEDGKKVQRPVMGAINQDILSKNICYALKNLSVEEAEELVGTLTAGTAVQWEPELTRRVVADLAGGRGEVRPIEVQIVGAQLQERGIRGVAAYGELARGDGETPVAGLVEGYVMAVVEACGREQEDLAAAVLYGLTDEGEIRPKRSEGELRGLGEADRLGRVLEILVLSGLVLRSEGAAGEPLYQFVHDYLAEFVRPWQQERNRLLLAQTQAERDLLAAQNQGLLLIRRRLALATVVSACLVAGTVAYSSWSLQRVAREQQVARERLEAANQQILVAEARAAEIEKSAGEAVETAARDRKVAQLEARAAKEAVTAAEAELEGITAEAEAELAAAATGVSAATAAAAAAQRDREEAQKQAAAAQILYTAAVEKRDEVEQGTQLERLGNTALKIFEFSPLEGLRDAVRVGTGLKELMKGKDIKEYLAFSPLFALQQTIDNIQERNRFQGHESLVLSVAWSPDGQTLASASSDRTVRLWDRQGNELARFQGHESTVWSVAWSPDGQTLASASSDRTVRLWDRQGNELARFQGHESGVLSVAWSPDGQTLASASSDRTVRLWPIRSLDELLTQACDRLHDYLTTNPTVSDADRALCNLPPRDN